MATWGDGDHAARSADGLLTSVGLPAGSVLLSRTVYRLPLLVSGEQLRLVDPRTGKLTETRRRLDGAVDVIDPPPPAITGQTASNGIAARAPILVKTVDGDAVQADGVSTTPVTSSCLGRGHRDPGRLGERSAGLRPSRSRWRRGL